MISVTPLTAWATRSLGPVALLGGAALWLGSTMWPQASGPAMYRLVLHAPEQEDSCYVSAWNEGEVYAAIDPRDPQPIELRRHSEAFDGCRWTGVETLEPLTATTYHYRYEEIIESCEEGAVPTKKTPRAGFVTLERVGNAVTATAHDGEQPSSCEAIAQPDDDSDDGCGCAAPEAEADEADLDSDEPEVTVHDVELIDSTAY